MNKTYATIEPHRADMDALGEPTLLEFGNAWCGHCSAAQPLIAAALLNHPLVRHIKIADGPGLPLGRSYRVKLWPTLIFLDKGAEISRLVRPTTSDIIADALLQIDHANKACP
jgi:thioredoxin 1